MLYRNDSARFEHSGSLVCSYDFDVEVVFVFANRTRPADAGLVVVEISPLEVMVEESEIEVPVAELITGEARIDSRLEMMAERTS